MDNLTTDQLNQATQSLIDQKPLNKFLWASEYTNLQPALTNGDIWIASSRSARSRPPSCLRIPRSGRAYVP
jgi:spermidine/putrescine-binding protein